MGHTYFIGGSRVRPLPFALKFRDGKLEILTQHLKKRRIDTSVVIVPNETKS